MQSKTVGSQITAYLWDSQNRLVEVDQGATQATATTIAKYTYDVNGNRVQKVVPGTNGQADAITTYLVDPTFAYAQTAVETTTQGATTTATVYTWGNGLIGLNAAGQQHYAHADAQGSVKALTDASGNITDTYAYDAFGDQANRTGTTVNPFRYTTQYYDDAVALQNSRARWYDSSTGRFVSQDMFSGVNTQPVTLNRYLYANADPVDRIDPSGRFSGDINEFMSAIADNEILEAQPLPQIGNVVAKRVVAAVLIAGATLTSSTLALDPCFRAGNTDCESDGDTPIIVWGGDFFLHTQLVNSALNGGAPGLLHYIPKQKPRGWLKSTVNCADNYGSGSGLDCDEYPYASSYEGGEENIATVWLDLVPSGVNQGAGGKLIGFLNRCGVIPILLPTPQSAYLVRAAPKSVATLTYCRKNK